MRSGGVPFKEYSFSSGLALGRWNRFISAQVYGWTAFLKISLLVPVSMISPAYMTWIRSPTSAAMPRSWVTRITDVPIFSCSSRISSMISAWVVTSRAVVGCVKLVQRIRKPQQACCLPGFSLTLPLCLAHLLGSLFFLLQSTSMARMGNVCMFRTCRPLCT